MSKEEDQLDTALSRAISRGIQYKKELRLAPREEQIEWIAEEIFFKLYGGYMGQPYFCDLPPEEKGSPEQDGRKWRLSKKPYKEVADFILKIFGPDNTEVEEIEALVHDNAALMAAANSEANEVEELRRNYIYEINELNAELMHKEDDIRELQRENAGLKFGY